MSSWHSYPSIFALGHKALVELFNGPVTIEEKVDGSQFSFGVFEEPVQPHEERPDSSNVTTVLRIKSKGAIIIPDAPPKLFKLAVETVQRLFAEGKLKVGWTYRGEVIASPKHNVLAYDRVPTGNIILFDINDGHESYLPYPQMLDEAHRLGLEAVPALLPPDTEVALTDGYNTLRGLLETTSILGGQKIEGFVVKNYKRFGIDGKVLMGKFVSETFKEVHAGEWKKENPKGGDVLDRLTEKYRTPARWAKARQHLAELSELTDSPKDIGKLIHEAQEDLKKEEEASIKQFLWDWAWPHLSRRSIAGLPEWYKDELMKKQFEVSAPAAATEVKP